MRAEGVCDLKTFKDPTEYPTRNLPPFGAVPQPTVPPHTVRYLEKLSSVITRGLLVTSYQRFGAANRREDGQVR